MTCIAISEMRMILFGYLLKKDFKRLDMKSVCFNLFYSKFEICSFKKKIVKVT